MNKYKAVIPLKHHSRPKSLEYILATEDFSALQAFVEANYDPPVSLEPWSEVAFSRTHEYMSCDGLSAQQAVNKLYMDVLVSLQDQEDDARFEEDYEEPPPASPATPQYTTQTRTRSFTAIAQYEDKR